jgi:hypothetical protein
VSCLSQFLIQSFHSASDHPSLIWPLSTNSRSTFSLVIPPEKSRSQSRWCLLTLIPPPSIIQQQPPVAIDSIYQLSSWPTLLDISSIVQLSRLEIWARCSPFACQQTCASHFGCTPSLPRSSDRSSTETVQGMLRQNFLNLKSSCLCSSFCSSSVLLLFAPTLVEPFNIKSQWSIPTRPEERSRCLVRCSSQCPDITAPGCGLTSSALRRLVTGSQTPRTASSHPNVTSRCAEHPFCAALSVKQCLCLQAASAQTVRRQCVVTMTWVCQPKPAQAAQKQLPSHLLSAQEQFNCYVVLFLQ